MHVQGNERNLDVTDNPTVYLGIIFLDGLV